MPLAFALVVVLLHAQRAGGYRGHPPQGGGSGAKHPPIISVGEYGSMYGSGSGRADGELGRFVRSICAGSGLFWALSGTRAGACCPYI